MLRCLLLGGGGLQSEGTSSMIRETLMDRTAGMKVGLEYGVSMVYDMNLLFLCN